jgi:hypothetical protein
LGWLSHGALSVSPDDVGNARLLARVGGPQLAGIVFMLATAPWRRQYAIAKLGGARDPGRGATRLSAFGPPGRDRVGREHFTDGRATMLAGLGCILGRGKEMGQESRQRSPAARP